VINGGPPTTASSDCVLRPPLSEVRQSSLPNKPAYNRNGYPTTRSASRSVKCRKPVSDDTENPPAALLMPTRRVSFVYERLQHL
jgi:hypothetical protein